LIWVTGLEMQSPLVGVSSMVPFTLSPSNVAWTIPLPFVDGSLPKTMRMWSVKVWPPIVKDGSPSAFPPLWQVALLYVPLSV
jgi:hypothetical protein